MEKSGLIDDNDDCLVGLYTLCHFMDRTPIFLASRLLSVHLLLLCTGPCSTDFYNQHFGGFLL